MAIDVSKIPISPIVEAGGFLFLSGQLGFETPGVLAPGSIREQTRQVLRNIESVLASKGADLSNVVKATIWLINVADFPAFNEEYAARFSGMIFPARSTVISSLVVPGALVEIEVIARCP